MLKEACDTFAMVFSKKNNTRLQLLENEPLSISRRKMTIDKYFNKVKSSCHEKFELDLTAAISESRMKRIIVYDLRPKFTSFVITLSKESYHGTSKLKSIILRE